MNKNVFIFSLLILVLFLVSCQVELTDEEINQLSPEERQAILDESPADGKIVGKALAFGKSKTIYSQNTRLKIALKEIEIIKREIAVESLEKNRFSNTALTRLGKPCPHSSSGDSCGVDLFCLWYNGSDSFTDHYKNSNYGALPNKDLDILNDLGCSPPGNTVNDYERDSFQGHCCVPGNLREGRTCIEHGQCSSGLCVNNSCCGSDFCIPR